MKIPSDGGAAGAAWTLTPGDGMAAFWILRDTRRNCELARLTGAAVNGLREAEAIELRRRQHGRGDGTGAELETLASYPFGGEAEIARRMMVRDGFIAVCVDVKPGRGEIVRQFDLDGWVFPGEWQQAAMVLEFPAAGTAPAGLEPLALDRDGVLWEGAAPPLLMVLTDADGFQLEVGAGDDWWRLAGDGVAGNCPRCRIERTADGIVLRREVLNLAEDMALERRPWRFNYYLAWSDGRRREALGGFKQLALADLPDPEEGRICGEDMAAVAGSRCWQAPATRKLLRKLVRREAASGESGHLTLTVSSPSACMAAAHLERPARKILAHWPLGEMVDFHDWAGRQLGERAFRLEFPADSLWHRLPSGRYLENTPVGKVELR